jgi:hypothetical protein
MQASGQAITLATGMKAPSIPWTENERLELVGWLEDNWVAMGEDKQKKKAQWWQMCKEEKFPTAEHISAKRIGEKVGNMRRVFNEVHASTRTTGWGLTEEDTEASINGIVINSLIK